VKSSSSSLSPSAPQSLVAVFGPAAKCLLRRFRGTAFDDLEPFILQKVRNHLALKSVILDHQGEEIRGEHPFGG
jgi:hypothetical protein